jgi:hypothetical protein
MDRRLETLLNRQRTAGFTGLSGSQARAAIRMSTPLLNEAIATFVGAAPAITALEITPRAGNRFDVHVKMAKPAFLPAINVTVTIERQPQFPADPTLVLQLTGAGGLMRFAGPALGAFGGGLPPGVRMEGDRVFVDIRAVLAAQGQKEWLDYVEQLQISTDEGALILYVQARVA